LSRLGSDRPRPGGKYLALAWLGCNGAKRIPSFLVEMVTGGGRSGIILPKNFRFFILGFPLWFARGPVGSSGKNGEEVREMTLLESGLGTEQQGHESREPAQSPRWSWVYPLAISGAVLNLLQLVLGGIVTSLRAGDSDPNWNPLRLWVWLREVSGGQYFELRHRVLGALIGIAAISIVIAAWKSEKRSRVRKMSYWLLILVVFQGILGGLRVHAISSPSFREVMDQFFFFLGKMDPGTAGRIAFAMVHALMAQVTLLLFFGLAIMTGKTWWRLKGVGNQFQLKKLSRLAWGSTFLLFLQLLLGAFVRHATFPVALKPVTTILVFHIVLAIGIAVMVTLTLFQTARHFWEEPLLRKPMTLATVCLFLQLLLGVGAWLSVKAYGTQSDLIGFPILIRGAHLLNAGILLLALSQLAFRAKRMTGRPAEPGNFLNLEAGQE